MPNRKFIRIANWGAIEREAGPATAQVIQRLVRAFERGAGTTIVQNIQNIPGGNPNPPGGTGNFSIPLRLIGKPPPQLIIGADPSTLWHHGVQLDGTYKLESRNNDTLVIQPKSSGTQTSDYFAVRNNAGTDLLELDANGYLAVGNPTALAAWLTLKTEASAPTEANITTLAPEIWLDANDPYGDGTDPSGITDDTDINDLQNSRWTDKGSRADHCTSSFGTDSQPAWFKTAGSSPKAASLPNNKPYVSTVRGGVGSSNNISPTLQLNDFTLYAVMYLTNSNTTSTIVGGETGVDPGYAPSYLSVQDEDGSTGSFMQMRDNNESGDFQRIYTGSDLGGAGWYLIKITRTGSTWVHKIDDTTLSLDIAEGDQSQIIWLNEYFQRSDDNGGSVTRSVVYVAELLIWDELLSSGNQTTVEDYLKNKYNVAGGFSGGGGAPFTHLKDENDNIVTEFDEDGHLHIGGENPVSALDVTSINEQFRPGYDASNYASFTVDSSGNLTINLTGTTPQLTISDDLILSTGNLYFVNDSTGGSIVHSGTSFTIDPDIDNNIGTTTIRGLVTIDGSFGANGGDTLTLEATASTGGAPLEILRAGGATSLWRFARTGEFWGPDGTDEWHFKSRTDDDGITAKDSFKFQSTGSNPLGYLMSWLDSSSNEYMTLSQSFRLTLRGTADLRLEDNVQLQMGTASDWDLAFDGTNLVLAGTGQLRIVGAMQAEGFVKLTGAAGAVSELTISTGAITATASHHTVDTESDAASDDLDTINGGTLGAILVLRAANTARTVVIKDGTGNIHNSGDGDFSLDDTEKVWVGVYNGTDWIGIGDGGSGGGGSSPLTTKGDIWGYDTGDERIPVGSDGQVLTADSGAALGVAWSSPAGGGTWAPSTTAQSSAHTAAANEVVLCDTSGGAFTVTLPAAASNTDEIIIVKLVTAGSDLTIDGNGAETIDGSTTITLDTAGQSRTLVSDGSNWHII